MMDGPRLNTGREQTYMDMQEKERHMDGSHRRGVKASIGDNHFESEGELNLEAFKLWIAAVAPVDLDEAALVETLKGKGQDITKFAEALVSIAAKMDAAAPASETPPVTP